LAFVWTTGTIRAADTPASEQEAKQQKADSSLKVVEEWIKRGMYTKAQGDLAEVEQAYGSFLTDTQKQKAKSLAGQIQTALAEREKIVTLRKQIDQFIAGGNYAEAKKLLLQIQASPYVNEMEKSVITADLDKVNASLSQQAQPAEPAQKPAAEPVEVTEVPAVVEVVEVKAEQPAVEVVEVKVEEATPVQAEAVEVTVEQPAAVQPEVVAVPVATEVTKVTAAQPAQPVTPAQQNSYLREVIRKQEVQRSYTRAMVADALNKADQAKAKQDFTAARTALRNAFSTLENNRLLLGDEYGDLKKKLTEKEEIVASEEKTFSEQQAKIKQEQADQITTKIRQDLDVQRAKAVGDYMERALAFEAEERYEEALGQLEQLLAVDPHNREALIKRKTLENTIRWVEQLRIKHEAEKEEMQLILETSGKSTPFSKEINNPRNWKEISKRREQMLQEQMSPADVAVNKLLDQPVNLSALTPETTFEEAINILRDSVQPQLSIAVMWKDITENAFIDKDTPITLSGEGLVSVPLRVGLERVLQAVSAGGMAELGYVVQYGIVTIATVDYLPKPFTNVVYDVAELLSPPADFDEYNGGIQGVGQSNNIMGQNQGNQAGQQGGQGGSSGGQNRGNRRSSGSSSQYLGSWRSREMGDQLIDTILQTIDPDSWYDNGGDARIEQFMGTKLIVWQTPENHEKIRKFLDEMRKQLGQQVAIEARFLLVDEHFLEDIGLDVQINRLKVGGKWNSDAGEGVLMFTQNSYNAAASQPTAVGGTLGGATPSLTSGFAYVLDDLQVDFLLRATQMHSNSRQLTAPKAMVLSGESATLQVTTVRRLRTDATLGTETITPAEGQPITNAYIENTYEDFDSGVRLSITPTITSDMKYVILRITTYTLDLTDNKVEQTLGFNPTSGEEVKVEISYPTEQVSSVQTRVSIPDRGTVFLGGLTLTAQAEREAGVPILSKIPIISRFFSNRSEVQDKRILLILVKPTIVLQNEAEEDAVAAMGR
jgi:tetratricopeptide (TPR) repeat protein